MKENLLFAWSGGKDSAMALYELSKNKNSKVASLLTTVTEGYDRISMHGVRRALLQKQAAALGYPLEEILIPQQCTDEIYESRMQQVLEKYRAQGIATAAFGDLFLQDVRQYREERMGRIGMKCLFPLWGRNTADLARRFVDLGFRAILVCIDTDVLDRSYAGREYDYDLLSDLPKGIDPCAENGEFHTFVYDGPIFCRPVPVHRGEKILRENRFYYCDLLDAGS
jgi:uncharacterized protein (TIGR00290 family)